MCQPDELGKDNIKKQIIRKHMLDVFDADSMDFNSITVGVMSKLLAGDMRVEKVSKFNYSASQDDMVIMHALAQFNNGVVTPVAAVTLGDSTEVSVGGIYCGCSFKNNSPEFFTEFGLDMIDFGIKRVCTEFNDGSNPSTNITPDIEDMDCESIRSLPITQEQFFNFFLGIVDLTYSYQLIPASKNEMSFSRISTHNVFASGGTSFYMMPCTVEFKTNVKTIGYFMVEMESGGAMPILFLGSEINAEDCDQRSVRTIRPIIISPLSDGEVIVSEGTQLKLVSQSGLISAYRANKK